MIFVQRFTLAGNARDRKIIKLGIVNNISATNAHVWVIQTRILFPLVYPQ